MSRLFLFPFLGPRVFSFGFLAREYPMWACAIILGRIEPRLLLHDEGWYLGRPNPYGAQFNLPLSYPLVFPFSPLKSTLSASSSVSRRCLYHGISRITFHDLYTCY